MLIILNVCKLGQRKATFSKRNTTNDTEKFLASTGVGATRGSLKEVCRIWNERSVGLLVNSC